MQHPQVVCELVGPILRSKYPAISAEEQAISVPLQLLCLAILDAVLLHIVSAVAAETWQPVRRRLSEALIHEKQARTCDIIAAYPEVDVFFIQVRLGILAARESDTRRQGGGNGGILSRPS